MIATAIMDRGFYVTLDVWLDSICETGNKTGDGPPGASPASLVLKDFLDQLTTTDRIGLGWPITWSFFIDQLILALFRHPGLGERRGIDVSARSKHRYLLERT